MCMTKKRGKRLSIAFIAADNTGTDEKERGGGHALLTLEYYVMLFA